MPPKIQLKYDLLPEPYIDPVTKTKRSILRPKIPVKLGYGINISRSSVDCLLDSGADLNLFPAYMGKILEMNIKNGVKTFNVGIGGKKITCYLHKVKLYFNNQSIETLVNFSDEQEFPILGRDGFFNYFEKIVFDYKNKEIILSNLIKRTV